MADPLECVICGTHITYPQRAPRLDALIDPKSTIRDRLTLILGKEEDGIQDQSNQERICEICHSVLRRVDKSGCVLAKAREQIVCRWRNKRLLKQFDPLSVLEEIEVHEEVVESNESSTKRKRKDSNASVSSNDGASGKVKRGRPKKSMSTKYIEYNSSHLCSHCGVKLIEFQNHFCIYSPTCFICGAACGATRITSHILTSHPEVEQQKCSRCKSWFWTIEDLKCHVEQVHSTVSEAAKAAETLLNLSQSGIDSTQSEELAGAYNKALEYKFLGRCLPPVPRKEVKLKFCPLCDIRVSSDVFDWHMKAMHDGLGQDFDEPVSDHEESSGILLATDDGKNSIVCCGILFDNAESVAEHVQLCHVRKVLKSSRPESVQDQFLPPVAGEEVVCDSLGEGELVAFVTEDDVSGYEVYIESSK